MHIFVTDYNDLLMMHFFLYKRTAVPVNEHAICWPGKPGNRQAASGKREYKKVFLYPLLPRLLSCIVTKYVYPLNESLYP